MALPVRHIAIIALILAICGILIIALFNVAVPHTPASKTYLPPSQSVYNITVENDWLTMSDGVKLAVMYIKPVPKTSGEKFPVLFEMLPYRKDDMFYSNDYQKGAYFARRGYVYARVDVRGTGTSEGAVPVSEYSEAELDDGMEVIDALSKMPYSNGNVGMFGISWGGFNSLMLAARNPPALKAVIAAHSSDDLYYNDVHFIDGVFHIDTYEPEIVTDNAFPAPDRYEVTPAYFSDRFDQKPWIFTWKEQQVSNVPLWRNESLHYKANLTVPIYFIGGLLDGYRDTIPRLMNSSVAPVKADIGPWNHMWPNDPSLGPNYEWRQKATRWWDYWLKGKDTGILDEPRFMVFVRQGYSPSTTMTEIPGEWRCGDWPVRGIAAERWYPQAGHKLTMSPPGMIRADTLAYHAGSGIAIQDWWGELTGDMAPDDAESLTYDSAPLTEPVEIIGNPLIRLNVSADAPRYYWTVRLEDVWPDGNVSLVSGALINPSHSFYSPDPKALVPDVPTQLSADIHYTTWRFEPDHRIRLAVANSQFPMGWPTPYAGNTTLYSGLKTSLDLPVVMKDTLTAACDLPEAEPMGDRPGYTALEGDKQDYPIIRNVVTGDTVSTWGADYRWKIHETLYHVVEFNRWHVNDHDPAHATYDALRIDEVTLSNRSLNLTDTYFLVSDRDSFNLTLARTLSENGVVIREKTWNEVIPWKYQ
jgi:predicted acyl esterase